MFRSLLEYTTCCSIVVYFPWEFFGLARGDIITKINDQLVHSLGVIKAAQAAYETKPEPMLFEVQRNRRVSLYILKP